MADEARQTSRQDHSAWSNDVSLRSKPVLFISAGPVEPLNELEDLLNNIIIDESSREPISTAERDQTQRQSRECMSESQQFPAESGEVARDALLHHDTSQGHARPSSEVSEVIGPEELEMAIQSERQQAKQSGFFFDLSRDCAPAKKSVERLQIPDRASPSPLSSDDEVILFTGRSSQKAERPPTDSFTLSMRQMETQEVAGHLKAIARGQQKVNKSRDRIPHGKSHNAINSRHWRHDSDEDAMIADYIANIRESGEVDSFLHANPHNERDLGGSDLEPISGTDIIDQVSGNKKSSEDQGDHRSGNSIDDETLARIIAVQDLGFGIGFDQGSPSAGDSDPNSEGPSKNPKQIRPHGIVNAYDYFDPMDWERPSLRRKKGKGAKAKLQIEVSDSETEQRLQAAWKNDRMKKSERKQRREELRALGMLSRNANPADLRVKYPMGMNMYQVTEELRSFLLSSSQRYVAISFGPVLHVC